MLAAWTHAAELAISEEESKKLAEAIARVQALYDVSVFSETTAAWVNLVFACGTIYGPRIIAIRVRMKKEEALKKMRPVSIMSDPDTGNIVTGVAN